MAPEGDPPPTKSQSSSSSPTDLTNPTSPDDVRFRLRVEHEDPDSRVLVAIEQPTGEVVGLATAGRSRDPDRPTSWELYSLHTVPAVHGTGLADELLVAAVGVGPASLWVLVTNARARAFYRRHGFVVDEVAGAVRVHEASGDDELRMVRPAR